MKIFNRLLLTAKTNLNTWFEETQNPEQMMETAMEKMEQQLIHVRQTVAVAIASQKRSQREILQHQSMAKKYYQKAQKAVIEKKEVSAKEALTTYYEYKKNIEVLQSNFEDRQKIIDKLRKQLRSLEQKISNAKMKKNLYIARATSAQASYKIQELNGDIIGMNDQAFAMMEEKVLQLEAEAELIASSSL